MLEAIAPWPGVGGRIRDAWPWLSMPAQLLPDGAYRKSTPICLNRCPRRGRQRRRDARAAPRLARVAVQARPSRGDRLARRRAAA